MQGRAFGLEEQIQTCRFRPTPPARMLSKKISTPPFGSLNCATTCHTQTRCVHNDKQTDWTTAQNRAFLDAVDGMHAQKQCWAASIPRPDCP